MPTPRAALAILAAATFAHAQVDPPPPDDTRGAAELAEEQPSLPFWVEAKARYIHAFDADLDDGGDFSVDRVNAQLRFLLPLHRRLIVDTDIAYEYDDFDFSAGGTGLAAQAPWSEVTNLHVRPMLIGIVSDDLTLLAAPVLDWFAENDADFGSAFTIGGLAALRYQLDDDLAVGLGVQGITRLDRSPAIAPVLILNWQATDDLLVRTNDFDVGTGGGSGIEALYTLADEWRVGAGFQVQYRNFRLNDTGYAPNGSGSEFTVPIYARLDYLPTPKIILSVFAGTYVAGNLQVRDADGNKLLEEDYDPSLGLGVQIQARF